MTPKQKERYARHLLLSDFGEEAQKKLLSTKVLLIGAGGLGSPCALYLAAAGVGSLTIVDHDIVELSNLQRQILHNETKVGMKKVESAQDTLSTLNQDVSIQIVDEAFTVQYANELVQSHDLVIDGSDNFQTRFLANDACYLNQTPLIYGSIFQYEGQLTVFDFSKNSVCYRCLVPEIPEDGAVPNCLEAGVIGTLPGIIGSLQAMEAIKWIAGIGEPPVGKMIYYSALDTSFRTIQLSKDVNCPLCSDRATIKELIAKEYQMPGCDLSKIEQITAGELKLLLTEKELFLIDVREPEEFAQSRIPTSNLIPLGQLERHLEKLPMDQTLYIHCKAGTRSLKAIEVLQKNGFEKLVNVSDGIIGWED